MAISLLGADLPILLINQGASEPITVEFVNEEDEPINVSKCKCELRICPYGMYSNPILTIDGIVSETQPNFVSFPMKLEDTQFLSPTKYEYMPVAIYDDNGTKNEHLQGRGVLYLRPRIKSNNKNTLN